MVIKSLTITEDAYDALKALKYGNESFSEVILRVAKNKKGLLDKYFGAFKGGEAEALALIDKIKNRKASINKEVESRRIKLSRIGAS